MFFFIRCWLHCCSHFIRRILYKSRTLWMAPYKKISLQTLSTALLSVIWICSAIIPTILSDFKCTFNIQKKNWLPQKTSITTINVNKIHRIQLHFIEVNFYEIQNHQCTRLKVLFLSPFQCKMINLNEMINFMTSNG